MLVIDIESSSSSDYSEVNENNSSERDSSEQNQARISLENIQRRRTRHAKNIDDDNVDASRTLKRQRTSSRDGS